MQLPEFSLSGWKYPDKYDVDELPIPGQCYDYESGFVSALCNVCCKGYVILVLKCLMKYKCCIYFKVQRVYYKIRDLEISCPEDFDYDDLDREVRHFLNCAISSIMSAKCLSQ